MGDYLQSKHNSKSNYEQCVTEHGSDTEAEECWLDNGWHATYMHLKDIEVEVERVSCRRDAWACG